jgi:hypothetical protein
MHYLGISLIELLRTIREREIIVFKCDQYIPLIFNSQVKRILEKFHDNNGHLGMERTFCALSSQYHCAGKPICKKILYKVDETVRALLSGNVVASSHFAK